VASSWFLFFSYHNDARSNKLLVLRHLITKACDRSQISTFEICCCQSGSGIYFLGVFQSSPVTVMPQILHTHSFTYYRRCITILFDVLNNATRKRNETKQHKSTCRTRNLYNKERKNISVQLESSRMCPDL